MLPKRIEFQFRLVNCQIDGRRQPSDFFLNGRALQVLLLVISNQLAAIIPAGILQRRAVGKLLVQRHTARASRSK